MEAITGTWDRMNEAVLKRLIYLIPHRVLFSRLVGALLLTKLVGAWA